MEEHHQCRCIFYSIQSSKSDKIHIILWDLPSFTWFSRINWVYLPFLLNIFNKKLQRSRIIRYYNIYSKHIICTSEIWRKSPWNLHLMNLIFMENECATRFSSFRWICITHNRIRKFCRSGMTVTNNVNNRLVKPHSKFAVCNINYYLKYGLIFRNMWYIVSAYVCIYNWSSLFSFNPVQYANI